MAYLISCASKEGIHPTRHITQISETSQYATDNYSSSYYYYYTDNYSATDN